MGRPPFPRKLHILRMRFDRKSKEMNIEKPFLSYIEENDLDIELSCSMPAGYEAAFGTFDITCKTLFLNAKLLKSGPVYEALYYFYHELRHAVQYIHPERFDGPIQKSIHYVILYNGTCFKLVNGAWRDCQLCGGQAYFTLAYENLPYEMDANQYARDTVKALLPKYDAEIESLYRSWLPEKVVPQGELETLYRQIDQAVCGERLRKGEEL